MIDSKTDGTDDPREFIRRALYDYFEEQAPDDLEELNVVFDTTYGMLLEEVGDPDASSQGARGVGLPIDAAFVEGALVASGIWITANLVHGALRSRGREALSRRLDDLERWLGDELAGRGEELELLRGVRERVEAVLAGASRAGGSQAARPAGSPRWTGTGAGAGAGGQDAVQLFVERRNEGRHGSLRYVLHAPKADLYMKKFGEADLALDPRSFFEEFLRLFERTPLETEDHQELAERQLRAKGAQLFQSLLPEPLRETLWELLDAGRLGSLQIVSDEPWIPWELFRFYGRREDPQAAGPFWGEAWVVTRWLRGTAPAARMPLSRMAVVLAGDADLPHARAERAMLAGLEGRGRSVEDVPARLNPLLEALAAGEHDGWHFICHGDAGGGNADRWPLCLEGYEDLTPDLLQGEASGVGASRPLVFLNACRTGRTGLSLTGLGGWAPAFLAAGAGAFLAPLWSMKDSRASAFAEAFYRHFLGGSPLGEAVRLSRLELRERFPGDASGLGYVVFGAAGAHCASSA